VYRILYEDGRIVECEIADSFAGCIGKSTAELPFFSVFPLILFSGLLDGINPCAFAVLFFFLVFLCVAWEHDSSYDEHKIMVVGSVYIPAVYLGCLLIWLAIIGTVSLVGLSRLFATGGVVLALVLGAVNVKDCFWSGQGLSLKISRSKWKTIAKWMHRATIPSSFIVGLIVSIVEFPCPGDIYLAILGVLASNMTFIQGFGYLLLYNIAFVCH